MTIDHEALRLGHKRATNLIKGTSYCLEGVNKGEGRYPCTTIALLDELEDVLANRNEIAIKWANAEMAAERRRALLLALEWTGSAIPDTTAPYSWSRCPSCWGWNITGHRPDCALAAELKEDC